MPTDKYYGPYVVLSDGSTFDSVLDDCVVAFITPEAQAELEDCNDFTAVEDEDMKVVTISDLIDAYYQNVRVIVPIAEIVGN